MRRKGDNGIPELYIDAKLAGVVYFHFYDLTAGWVYEKMPFTTWRTVATREAAVREIAEKQRMLPSFTSFPVALMTDRGRI